MTSTQQVEISIEKPHMKTKMPPSIAWKMLARLNVAICVALAVGGTGFGLAVHMWTRLADLERQVKVLTDAGAIVSTSAISPEGYGTPISLHSGAGEWAPGTSMPSERSDLQALNCSGTIFLLGGLTLNNTVVGTVYTFDPVDETYAELATQMPTPRYRFGAACLDDKIYVAGGFDSSEKGNTGESLSSVDVYNIAENTWAAGPPLAVPRGDLALAAVNGKLHAIGGYNHSYATMATNEVLDPARGGWTLAAPMPRPKGDIQAACVGAKLFVPGGWNNGFLADLVVYDAPSDTWSTLAPMAAARGDKAVLTLNGNVFVLGGEQWSGRTSTCDWGWGPEECAVNLIPMHSVEMYSPADNTWTAMSPLPASRFRFAAAAVDSRGSEGAIFAFGGHEHGEIAVKTQWQFHYVERRPLYVHASLLAA